MYILSGRFECYRFDPRTDQKTMSWVAAAGDSVVVPSLEPHGMRNLSDTEPATFLCCICNLYEKETI
jgi:mannose-6-phosphate isomerase-like protein (cupin superfamily)